MGPSIIVFLAHYLIRVIYNDLFKLMQLILSDLIRLFKNWPFCDLDKLHVNNNINMNIQLNAKCFICPSKGSSSKASVQTMDVTVNR